MHDLASTRHTTCSIYHHPAFLCRFFLHAKHAYRDKKARNQFTCDSLAANGKSKREDGSNFTEGMTTGLAALGAGLRGGEAFDCLLTGVALDASALGTGDDVTATSTATSGA